MGGGTALVASLTELFNNLIFGKSYYHLWYVYMLIGVYALLPLVVRLRMNLSEKSYTRVAFAFLIVGSLSLWTSSYQTEWNIGRSFCYLSYAMAGYAIKRKCSVKNNAKGLLDIALGLIIEVVVLAIQYNHTLAGISESMETYSIVAPYNPLVLLASILVFVGFSLLDVHGSHLQNASKYCYYIYLIHAGVWNVIYIIAGKIIVNFDWTYIIVFVAVTLAISYGLSVFASFLLEKMTTKLQHKFV